MDFEWDPEKNKLNLKKHGVTFEDAPSVFDGFSMTVQDKRKNYGERRFCTMGLGEQRRVLIIAHTYRNSKIRIISMRKANKREQKIFYDYFNRYLQEE